MKRDMDLIRALLLKLEAVDVPAEDGLVSLRTDGKELSIQGDNPKQIFEHARMLFDAGFIDATDDWQSVEQVDFRNLTWGGCDFLDSVRDGKIWEKNKHGAVAAGGWTADLLKDLAKGFLKTQIKKQTGIEL